MCYSLGASLGAGCLSLVLSALLFFRDWGSDRRLAVFIPTVALMQLAEGVVWVDLPDKHGSYAIAGRIGLLALAAQAIVLAGSGLWCPNKHAPPGRTSYLYQKTLTWIALKAGLLFLPTVIYAQSAELRWHVGPHGHLVWDFLKLFKDNILLSWTYMIVFVTIWGTWQPLWHGMVIGVFAFFSYYFAKIHSDLSWGSVWCYSANGVGFIQLLLGLVGKAGIFAGPGRWNFLHHD